MNIISTEKGTYDLSTNEGRYKYIAEFILSKGANGDIFSCLEKLFTEAKKIEELKELHRMQLVACSTAALANTEKSKEFRIGKESPYWTPAYQDVCGAVDREIRYREALDLYANPFNHKEKIEKETSIPDFYHDTDFGMFAREALKGVE